ncbi:MAG: DHA2 family efflux MFS transporter permease subunit [Syntrophales bacterium]|jgi:DHA2 family multidrug resistance protein|nr:DHA2 family efflux MFS transporter permease subunit [Syntrophales bacterium]
MTSQRTPPRINKWLIAAIIMLPTFLHVMDISVVNVSLPHIQGSLNAGVDEVTWVITSYLVTNAIIIPIAPWLARLFGRKRYLLASVALFTLSSLACGASTSLTMLICFRVLQGLAGGGLAPLGQAILLETFPQKEHGMANAIFGMGVTVAPVLGPVFGGWLTDQWSWPWVFYINLPAGVMAFFLLKAFIDDPPYLRSTRMHIDTWGILFLSVGLGCLQVVLDKGEREDWFSSRFIITLGVIAVVSLLIFFWVERKTPYPVVDLKPFRNRGFAAANVINFFGYFTLLGSIVLLPLYLQKLMGYTALWAGLVLGPGGFTSLIIMPIAGFLMIRGMNPKWLLGIGLALQAVSLWMMAAFNLEVDFMYVAWPRIVLGLALGLFFAPVATAAFANIPKEEIGNASGIFNLLRNLGGSVGIAFCTTIHSQRAQLHQTFLSENITPSNPAYQHYYQEILQWLQIHKPALANSEGVLSIIYQEVLRQANMLAFNDTFWLLGWLTACLVPTVLLLQAPKEKHPNHPGDRG